VSDLLCVSPADVPRFWDFACPLIGEAVDACGDWTREDIRAGLANGSMLLWLAVDGSRPDAVLVTQVVETSERVCWIIVCSGERLATHAAPTIARIEAYARAEGCGRVRMAGRKGWSRIFPDYRQPYITLEKVL
jgi:hypothetical protein